MLFCKQIFLRQNFLANLLNLKAKFVVVLISFYKNRILKTAVYPPYLSDSISDKKIKIPMNSNAESLNVSVACGILIWEMTKKELLNE